MISKQDVEKLASLSRLALTESEKDSFQTEIEAILGYVGKVKEASEVAPNSSFSQVNILRPDVVVHDRKEFTEALIDNAPDRDGDFVKVKKILE